jgi:hypothetical protein
MFFLPEASLNWGSHVQFSIESKISAETRVRHYAPFPFFLTTTSPMLSVARSLRSAVSRSGSYAVGAYILFLRVVLTFF